MTGAFHEGIVEIEKVASPAQQSTIGALLQAMVPALIGGENVVTALKMVIISIETPQTVEELVTLKKDLEREATKHQQNAEKKEVPMCKGKCLPFKGPDWGTGDWCKNKITLNEKISACSLPKGHAGQHIACDKESGVHGIETWV